MIDGRDAKILSREDAARIVRFLDVMWQFAPPNPLDAASIREEYEALKEMLAFDEPIVTQVEAP